MTDVLDRPFGLDLPDDPDEPELRPAPTEVVRPEEGSVLRAGLAALSAAAGVIHLVMVPSHWGESIVEGLGFAAVGWAQLVLAWLILTRFATRWLQVSIVLNLAAITAWIVSRTAGLPFGDHAGHAEDAGFVDVTTVGFEVAIVALSLLALAQPTLGRRRGPSRIVLGVLPFAVIALATAAIASPSARDHAAGSHGDAAGGAGHAHGDSATAGAGAAGAADGHHGGAAAVDDRGLAALSNGHHAAIGPEQPLDAATRAELTRQITMTQQAAALYPTVAAAEAAGYRRAGPFSPGLGTHYIRPSGAGLNGDGVMDPEDLLSPLSIIYDGSAPTSTIAGFMYYSTSAEAPVGFAGPNDIWHYHTNTCIKYTANGEIDAPFGADTEVPAALCEQAGGSVLETTQWMVHVWSVPGWESQQGLFGEVNPALSCPDGTYHQLPMEQWIQNPLNVCVNQA